TLILKYPLDIAHTRLAADIGRTAIFKKDGIPGPLYRGWMFTEDYTWGFVLNMMFRSTGAATILVLYDEVNKFMDWSTL
ncbi:hypothetical protein CFOL_v3_36194, partial [Cephalotus follicularis]